MTPKSQGPWTRTTVCLGLVERFPFLHFLSFRRDLHELTFPVRDHLREVALDERFDGSKVEVTGFVLLAI